MSFNVSGREVTVLLVEDEERLLLGLSAIVRRAGYRVLTSSNGSAGLQMAREHRPDLIVCDVMMPPPDGFALRQLLSEDPVTASIPFIFLTARTGQEDKIRGIEGGADDYITKPFDRQELLARIKAVLRRGELGRKHGAAAAEANAEHLRATLLSQVSLEMQRPVASLLTSLNGILAERFQNRPDRVEEYLNLATDSAQRLRATASDLVLLVALQRGESMLFRSSLDLHRDLRGPIDKCFERWRRFELRDLDLEVVVEPGLVVNAHPESFGRAVYHLVDNACKFSPEGGRVVVRAEHNGDGGCVLTVTDQGPAIPPLIREKVFEMFFQGPAASVERACGGLGVGLTVVRAVARSHGGDAVVVDAPTGCRVQMTVAPGAPDWDPAPDGAHVE